VAADAAACRLRTRSMAWRPLGAGYDHVRKWPDNGGPRIHPVRMTLPIRPAATAPISRRGAPFEGNPLEVAAQRLG